MSMLAQPNQVRSRLRDLETTMRGMRAGASATELEMFAAAYDHTSSRAGSGGDPAATSASSATGSAAKRATADGGVAAAAATATVQVADFTASTEKGSFSSGPSTERRPPAQGAVRPTPWRPTHNDANRAADVAVSAVSTTEDDGGGSSSEDVGAGDSDPTSLRVRYHILRSGKLEKPVARGAEGVDLDSGAGGDGGGPGTSRPKPLVWPPVWPPEPGSDEDDDDDSKAAGAPARRGRADGWANGWAEDRGWGWGRGEATRTTEGMSLDDAVEHVARAALRVRALRAARPRTSMGGAEPFASSGSEGGQPPAGESSLEEGGCSGGGGGSDNDDDESKGCGGRSGGGGSGGGYSIDGGDETYGSDASTASGSSDSIGYDEISAAGGARRAGAPASGPTPKSVVTPGMSPGTAAAAAAAARAARILHRGGWRPAPHPSAGAAGDGRGDSVGGLQKAVVLVGAAVASVVFESRALSSGLRHWHRW